MDRRAETEPPCPGTSSNLRSEGSDRAAAAPLGAASRGLDALRHPHHHMLHQASRRAPFLVASGSFSPALPRFVHAAPAVDVSFRGQLTPPPLLCHGVLPHCQSERLRRARWQLARAVDGRRVSSFVMVVVFADSIVSTRALTRSESALSHGISLVCIIVYVVELLVKVTRRQCCVARECCTQTDSDKF